MGAIDNAQAKTLLQAALGIASAAGTSQAGSAGAFPAPMWIRLMTANGSATANGTELGGTGYTAGGVSGFFSAVNTGAGGPTSQGFTAAAGNSWTAGANWVITGFELWDNNSVKLRWWFGTFTGGNVTVNTGQVLQIAQNAITVTLD